MNKFKKITAIILAVSSMATVLYSCSDDKSSTESYSSDSATEIIETVTEIETVEVEVTDEKGNVSVSVSEKVISIPVTKEKTEPEALQNNTTVKSASDITHISSAIKDITSVITTSVSSVTTKNQELKTSKAPVTIVATTKKLPVVDDTINEKSVGIFLLSKTNPVKIGSHANIVISGTPGKTYSIEFYETPSTIAKISELVNQKADSNGFVSWTFEIRNTCNLGKRKVIIKEIDSENYIETSITVRQGE